MNPTLRIYPVAAAVAVIEVAIPDEAGADKKGAAVPKAIVAALAEEEPKAVKAN